MRTPGGRAGATGDRPAAAGAAGAAAFGTGGRAKRESLEAATFWPPLTGYRGIPECCLKRQERVRMS